MSKFTVYIVLGIVFIFFSIALNGKGFIASGNLLNILRQTAMVSVMAVAGVFVLGAGQIDLTVASAPVTTAAAPVVPAVKAAPASNGSEGRVKVVAPMSGKILGVKVSVGQAVKKGEVVAVLEAMNMENDIVALEDGTIASINVNVGDSVETNQTLVTIN